MPSVASETIAVVSRPQLPNVRSQPDAEPATPFAELLDSVGPTAEPPSAPEPRQTRSDRSDRADPQQPADDGKADAAPANDPADTKDSTDAKVDKVDAKDAEPAKDTKTAKTDTAKPDVNVKTKPNAAKTAALDAMLGDALAAPAAAAVAAPNQPVAALNQPVAVLNQPVAAILALPVAAALNATKPAYTVEADALAAIQAATQQPGATNPSAAQADTKGATPAKGTAAADPQATAPQVEPGKNGESHANPDKASAEFRQAADLLAKPDAATPMQGQSDAAGAVKAGTDAMQILGLTAQANQPNATTNPVSAAANSPALGQPAAVPLSGLAVEIATQAHAGKSHFDIRLDPPELGRIDVKLNVDRDGNVSTRLVVDRTDTLDLLKRDAGSLERALQQAGLKTSDNALEFSLRQQNFAHQEAPAQSPAQLVISEDDPAPLEALRQGYGRLLGLGGGLDIRV